VIRSQKVFIVERIMFYEDINEYPVANTELIRHILKEENLEVCNIKVSKDTEVSQFTYKDVFVLFNSKATVTEGICKTLGVRFTNQGLPSLMESFGVRLPISHLNKSVFDFVNDLPYGAISDCKFHENTTIHEYDINKSFTNAFLNTECTRYFYDIYNDFVNIKISNIDELTE
jgi:hypothetical protein